MDKIEKIARAYREGIYGNPVDEKAWDASKSHWIVDAKKFVSLLKEAGLEIVEIGGKTA